jgi:hypothetical protein
MVMSPPSHSWSRNRGVCESRANLGTSRGIAFQANFRSLNVFELMFFLCSQSRGSFVQRMQSDLSALEKTVMLGVTIEKFLG